MIKDISVFRPQVKEALRILGIRNFLLGIHDAAFPSLPEEDVGCGSPYSDGAAQFLQFAADQGFDGIQFGPQGITTCANPSPYDGSLFSRNPLSLAPLAFTRSSWNLLGSAELAGFIDQGQSAGRRVKRTFAVQANQGLLAEICSRFRQVVLHGDQPASTSIRSSYVRFRRRNAEWLERDALYEVLRQNYNGNSWQNWGDSETARLDQQLFSPLPGSEAAVRMRIRSLHRRCERSVEDYCITQYLLAEQHRQLRSHCSSLDLKMFGDCQVGFSERDSWAAQSFLLSGYLLGAPPSRTNRAGQPWNYPVLDPNQYYLDDGEGSLQPGAAIRFFRARIDKLFEEFDGLRIDHPHGLICPWVYLAGQGDPLRAVQTGARLFDSPNLADHPGLARFAIVCADQINEQVAPYDDDRVTGLDPGQVRKYGILFEVLMAAAREKGRDISKIACEVLSTQPYPSKRVMELYGLGRFRVTQKVDLDNPRDVYRSENARPEDWLMLGNHDTPSVWKLVEPWFDKGTANKQAVYLANRLRIPEADRLKWLDKVSSDPGAFVQAKFADLFVGPATNVMVFFTDLLGMSQTYNQPGTIGDENWSLRIDPDYRGIYKAKAAQNLALNIPGALAMALRSQGSACVAKHRALIADLEGKEKDAAVRSSRFI